MYKIDQRLKIKSDDVVGQSHEYNLNLHSNHIYLFGEEIYLAGRGEAEAEPGVEYSMANRFIRNINLCMRANQDKPVVIHMKTDGGDWIEGMAIYNAIKACPYPVTILSYTHARSMSSLIFLAANKRIMMPDSYFMFHLGTEAFWGTYTQFMSYAEFTKTATNRMLGIYSEVLKEQGKFSGWSAERIERMLVRQMQKKEEVYLTAEQAV